MMIFCVIKIGKFKYFEIGTNVNFIKTLIDVFFILFPLGTTFIAIFGTI